MQNVSQDFMDLFLDIVLYQFTEYVSSEKIFSSGQLKWTDFYKNVLFHHMDTWKSSFWYINTSKYLIWVHFYIVRILVYELEPKSSLKINLGAFTYLFTNRALNLSLCFTAAFPVNFTAKV